MGSGPVALLLHGTGASTHSWRDLMPLLAQHFTVVAPDLPGHAFTQAGSPERSSLPGMAAGVAGLMARMGLRPTLVVGHSAGVAVLARLCLDRAIDPAAMVSLNGALLPIGGVAGRLFSPLARILARTPVASRLFARHASEARVVQRLIEQTGSRLDSAGLDLYARLAKDAAHTAGSAVDDGCLGLGSSRAELASPEGSTSPRGRWQRPNHIARQRPARS